jgi:Protein of unknown function (DUF3224)
LSEAAGGPGGIPVDRKRWEKRKMRAVTRRFLMATLILICGRIAAAQTAEDLVGKHLAALGGRAALAKVTSRSTVGTMTLSTPNGAVSGSIEILNQQPNRDEKPYSEGQDLPKMTRAAVTKTFTGDIAGEGRVEYLMMYRSDGSAAFVGLERVVGHLAGKAGSFVLQRTGVFEDAMAKESYFVIPGSGTGELRGLRGEGTSAVGHGTEHPVTLNYELG